MAANMPQMKDTVRSAIRHFINADTAHFGAAEKDLICRYYHEDVASLANNGDVLTQGWQALSAQSAFFRRLISNLQFTIDDIVAESFTVVIRWTARGVHDNAVEFPGVGKIEGTGNDVEVSGVSFCYMNEDGKIARVWQMHDHMALLEQMGVHAAPPAR